MKRKRLVIWGSVLTVVAISGLYIWARMAAFAAQQVAIMEVRKSGGHVFRSGDASWGFPERLEAMFHDIPYGVAFRSRETTDRQLECLPQFTWLSDVRLDNTQVTGKGLAILADCPQLDFLSIAGSRITDADLTALRRFPRLKTVWLGLEHCNEVGIENLAHVQGLESIAVLCPKCMVQMGSSEDRTSVGDTMRRWIERHSESCVKRENHSPRSP